MTEPELPTRKTKADRTSAWSEDNLLALYGRRERYSPQQKAWLEIAWLEDQIGESWRVLWRKFHHLPRTGYVLGRLLDLVEQYAHPDSFAPGGERPASMAEAIDMAAKEIPAGAEAEA